MTADVRARRVSPSGRPVRAGFPCPINAAPPARELANPGKRECHVPLSPVTEAGIPNVTIHWPMGGIPLGEHNCVGERRAAGQNRTVRLDVGAGVEQGIDGIDVVRTGRPVQRCLPMRTGEARPSTAAPAAVSTAMVPATDG